MALFLLMELLDKHWLLILAFDGQDDFVNVDGIRPYFREGTFMAWVNPTEY